MQYERKIVPSDFAGIYKDIAEIIGIEATMTLHNYLKGQQVTFPKKLFTKEYITRQVMTGNKNEKKEANDNNIKVVAAKYGYTERRLRQILKEYSQTKIT